jgi:hypothetical protein
VIAEEHMVRPHLRWGLGSPLPHLHQDWPAAPARLRWLPQRPWGQRLQGSRGGGRRKLARERASLSAALSPHRRRAAALRTAHGSGEASPGADVAEISPAPAQCSSSAPVQIWEGRAQPARG